MTPGDVDNKSYRLFLQKFLFELNQIQRLQNKTLHGILMHDDAPVHHEFKEFLDNEFPHRWIGPGSAYATWPHLSPDLHPLCFFLWGHIKSKVYGKPIDENDTIELANRIYHAFTEITPEMMEHAVKAYKARLKMVIESDGALVDPHHDNENDPSDSDIEAMQFMMYSF
uniref:Tc1-like transposase DDE domain-containing protein n=1 Tax=Acrobeloides nanus TaxID=290746 RepID=A0A914DCP7_9BILA